MSSQNMEKLKQADAAHIAASSKVEKAIKRLEAAEANVDKTQGDQREAGEDRATAYREAFSNGFVIVNVLDPALVSYHAGEKPVYDRAGVFEAEDPDQVWLTLDGAHAKGIQGLVTTSRGLHGPHISLNHQSQDSLDLSFRIPGIHKNAADELSPPDWLGANTDYRTTLEAIDWRLPTEAEMTQVLGAVAAAH